MAAWILAAILVTRGIAPDGTVRFVTLQYDKDPVVCEQEAARIGQEIRDGVRLKAYCVEKEPDPATLFAREWET